MTGSGDLTSMAVMCRKFDAGVVRPARIEGISLQNKHLGSGVSSAARIDDCLDNETPASRIHRKGPPALGQPFPGPM